MQNPTANPADPGQSVRATRATRAFRGATPAYSGAIPALAGPTPYFAGPTPALAGANPYFAAPSPALAGAARALFGSVRTLLGTAALALTLLGAQPAHAQWTVPGDQIRVTYGPAAYHFDPSEEHVNANHMVAAEFLTSRWTYLGAERSLAGFAIFDNSFGQFSQYLYVGLEWDLARVAGGDVYVNATFGLLHGYKEPYEDKIPFNQLGVAPVIIPTIGWRHGRLALTVTLLGGNGLLGGIGWTFDLP